VAGTHGKTTTTSMLSQVLLEADKDPSLFIGGRLPLINANGRSGQSDIMVCEACEFQDHYQAMTPAISILLNVDADHLDYFGTLENVIASFAKFAAKTTGYIIYNKADENTKKAIRDIPEEKCISYGLTPDCDWYADNIGTENGAYGVYDLYHKGEFVTTIQLGVPGNHNVSNSLAVAAAATLCGVTPDKIAKGIAHFKGAGRRFESIGEAGGITFIDDYAHHPTEIIASISTAKKMHYNKVWAVFQPFTFSRTARHLDEFAKALSLADEVVVSDIMGSREVNEWNVHSTQITAKIQNAHYLATFEEITEFVCANAKAGDLVLTMGGGDVYKCGRMMLQKIKEMQ
jgi:UDP-N-acetylmuramate--alanine ligase